MSVDADDFDVKLWLLDLKVSDPGIKKVLKNDISDKDCLIHLSTLDVSHLKLSVGDRSRVLRGIAELKAEQNPEISTPVLTEQASGYSISDTTPLDHAPTTSSEVAQPIEQVASSSVTTAPGHEEVKTVYTVEEVAAFLAGDSVPSNIQSLISQQRSTSLQQPQVQSQLIPDTYQPTGANPLANIQQSYVNSFQNSGYQFNPHTTRQIVPTRNPVLFSPNPWLNTPSYSQSWGLPTPFYQQQQQQSNLSTVPVFSPQRHALIPGRIATTTSINRDPQLQQLAEGYQSAAIRDLLTINEYNPSQNRSGEALYLPCNFVSHVRGSSRSEDEELLQTTSGAKLYLSHASKKIQPEKLSYGLFFGANARILARLIPQLTPEIAAYLDYLRKLGDLMVNYTASSVFLLDHEHRFEVLELGKSWNAIDPILSMNILKRRDPVSASSDNNSKTVPRLSNSQGTPGNSGANNSRRTSVICWQYNQPDGCAYTPNCRFLHTCNIVGCGFEHPAFKHIFRPGSSMSQLPTQRSQAFQQPATSTSSPKTK